MSDFDTGNQMIPNPAVIGSEQWHKDMECGVLRKRITELQAENEKLKLLFIRTGSLLSQGKLQDALDLLHEELDT